MKNKTFGLAITTLVAAVLYLNPSRATELGRTYSIDPALKAIPMEMQQRTEYAHLKPRYQIAMAALPKITFWGRVVDQYGQPVVGASIYNEGGNAWLASGGGAGFARTDDEGYFKIRNRGTGLSLGQIVHPEIEYGYPPDQGPRSYERSHQQFLIRSKWFISSITEGHPHDAWSKYTKKSKAYEIKVWRLGEYEGAKGGGSNQAASRWQCANLALT